MYTQAVEVIGFSRAVIPPLFQFRPKEELLTRISNVAFCFGINQADRRSTAKTKSRLIT